MEGRGRRRSGPVVVGEEAAAEGGAGGPRRRWRWWQRRRLWSGGSELFGMKRTQDQPPGIPTLIHRCRLKSPPATNRLKTRRRNENEKKKERDADDIRAAKVRRRQSL
ncbi:hypothetical protein KSS87_020090 [Heliosperma pusillum]|nr:hypothetical protein KSS87_020090 [Heliosperma pusillum]